MKDLSKDIIGATVGLLAYGAVTVAFCNCFTMSKERRDKQTAVGVACGAAVAAVAAVSVYIVESKNL